uniref:Uncharacterized protein n=1 Tax=Heterorhabditis bacteriophora TaxID=37862 RepID=A0A1I7XAG1_HETBA
MRITDANHGLPDVTKLNYLIASFIGHAVQSTRAQLIKGQQQQQNKYDRTPRMINYTIKIPKRKRKQVIENVDQAINNEYLRSGNTLNTHSIPMPQFTYPVTRVRISPGPSF